MLRNLPLSCEYIYLSSKSHVEGELFPLTRGVNEAKKPNDQTPGPDGQVLRPTEPLKKGGMLG